MLAFDVTAITASDVQERLKEGLQLAYKRGESSGWTVSGVTRSKELYVRSLAVAPSARGYAIGNTLVRDVERFAIDGRSQRHVDVLKLIVRMDVAVNSADLVIYEWERGWPQTAQHPARSDRHRYRSPLSGRAHVGRLSSHARSRFAPTANQRGSSRNTRCLLGS